MDISAIVLSSQIAPSVFAPRPAPTLPVSASSGHADVATSLRLGDGAGVGAGAGGAPGIASVIDKFRTEYALFRERANQPLSAQLSQATGDPLGQMQQTVSWALRSQTGILQVAVGFHAALSATHQSQNAVKTLVEKS